MAFNYINSNQQNGNYISNNVGSNTSINHQQTQIVSSYNNFNANPTNTTSNQTHSSYASYNQSSMEYTNNNTQERFVFHPNNNPADNNTSNPPNPPSQQAQNTQTEGYPSHGHEQKINNNNSNQHNSGYGGHGGYSGPSMVSMNKVNTGYGYRYINEIKSNSEFFKAISTTNNEIIVMFYNNHQKYSILLKSTIGIVGMKHREIDLLAVEISDAPYIHEMYKIYSLPSLILLGQNRIDIAQRLEGLDWISPHRESLGNVNGEMLEQKLIEHGFIMPMTNNNYISTPALSTNANANVNRLLMGIGDDDDNMGMTQMDGDNDELDIVD